MLVLTWNLYHGRSQPDRPHEQLDAFLSHLASWPWDVALLQEVPPWWPVPLARGCAASARMVRTSRNQLLPVRRALARRRPDIMKSSGGGANAILVRGAAITEHRRAVLRRRPEHRLVHAVRLPGSPLLIANLHAHVRPHRETRKDLDRAGRIVTAWAGDGPILLGGDCNVPDPHVAGFADLGGHGVDRVLGRGIVASASPRVLERDGLSDHAPVLVDVALPGRNALVAASSPT